MDRWGRMCLLFSRRIDKPFVCDLLLHSIDWQWIIQFNNFYFVFDNIGTLWDMDYCIPLKDPKLIEIIRGAVLWTLWNDRNRIIFQNGQVHDIKVLGSKIISVACFWALNQKQDLTSQLNIIFPCHLKNLIRITIVSFVEASPGSIRMLGTAISSSERDDDRDVDEGSDDLSSR